MILAVGPFLAVLAAASPAGITAAHGAADHDEVQRLAVMVGAAGLAPMLVSADRAQVAAALDAAPAAPDAWELLDDLARLAAGWDRSQAAPAARAAARIARMIDPELAIAQEIPDDKLASWGRSWAELGARVDRWGDVRVHATEVAANLAAARRATAGDEPGLGYDLAVTLHDADAEVRRVGCELLPQPLPADVTELVGDVVAIDADPAVALACAQALCAELKYAASAPVLVALGEDGKARLRAIFTAPLPEVPDGALIDAARCLAASHTKADGPALRALAAKIPRHLRRALRRVVRP